MLVVRTIFRKFFASKFRNSCVGKHGVALKRDVRMHVIMSGLKFEFWTLWQWSLNCIQSNISSNREYPIRGETRAYIFTDERLALVNHLRRTSAVEIRLAVCHPFRTLQVFYYLISTWNRRVPCRSSPFYPAGPEEEQVKLTWGTYSPMPSACCVRIWSIWQTELFSSNIRTDLFILWHWYAGLDILEYRGEELSSYFFPLSYLSTFRPSAHSPSHFQGIINFLYLTLTWRRRISPDAKFLG